MLERGGWECSSRKNKGREEERKGEKQEKKEKEDMEEEEGRVELKS